VLPFYLCLDISKIVTILAELDSLTPHDNHHSSRMRTYHIHFGEPLDHKPVLPFYLCLDISKIVTILAELDSLTPHDNHHSSRMRTYHIHFGEPLDHKPVLPFYLCLDISNVLSRALSCLRLSGHNFLVQRMRHNRNRRPYELRICDKRDWHSVQDEKHILLDCPHEHLVSLRTQHRQLVFPPQFEDSPTCEDIFEPTRYLWCGLFCG